MASDFDSYTDQLRLVKMVDVFMLATEHVLKGKLDPATRRIVYDIATSSLDKHKFDHTHRIMVEVCDVLGIECSREGILAYLQGD